MKQFELNHNRGLLKSWLSANTISTGRGEDAATSLHLAAWMGNIADLRLCLKEGQDITVSDMHGWTALHLAVWNMHAGTVSFLIEATSQIKPTYVSVQNVDGRSALHLAAWNNDVEVLELLLSVGAKHDLRDKAGLTPLIGAAKNGHVDAIRSLTKGGANISLRDSNNGMTPLHWAAQHGHAGAVKALVEEGVQVSIKDQNGLTAMHYALKNGHAEVIDNLKHFGANIPARDLSRLNWSGIEKIILKHHRFKGRDRMIKTLATTSKQGDYLNEAESFLLKLIDDTNEQTFNGLMTLCILASVYLEKGEFDRAEKAARKAVEGREKMLGRKHQLFHESVYILVQIYRAKGDESQATHWSALLPPTFEGNYFSNRH